MKISFAALFVSLLAGATSVSAAWDSNEFALRGPSTKAKDEDNEGNGNDKDDEDKNPEIGLPGPGEGENGEGDGNGKGKGPPDVEEECLSQYNRGICQKIQRMAERFAEDETFDPEEVTSLKQLIKDARPAKPDKMNFKDVANSVLEGNKGKDKDQKEMLMDIVNQLDGGDLQTTIQSNIEAGIAELEDGYVMEPTAGELEDSVDPPPIEERRRLGVPVKGNGNGQLWPSWKIKYYVVFEYNYAGYYTWAYNILPAMNELEQLTGLDFEVQGGVWTESSATRAGRLYVKVNSAGCWAHVGYYSGSATKMNIGNGCTSKGIIQHELLHVAGMLHQQSASYRDNYINVYLNNVPASRHHNFAKLPRNHGYEYIYDYGSLMHYGEYAFSFNGQKSISCRGYSCGQRSGLSVYDQYEIMVLYWGYYFVNGGL